MVRRDPIILVIFSAYPYYFAGLTSKSVNILNITRDTFLFNLYSQCSIRLQTLISQIKNYIVGHPPSPPKRVQKKNIPLKSNTRKKQVHTWRRTAQPPRRYRRPGADWPPARLRSGCRSCRPPGSCSWHRVAGPGPRVDSLRPRGPWSSWSRAWSGTRRRTGRSPGPPSPPRCASSRGRAPR